MHLDPADLLVPVALEDIDGAEVFPSQGVSHGKYSCASCGERVRFRAGGEIIQGHFAHLDQPVWCEFFHEHETVGHLYAKERIAKAIEGALDDIRIVRTCGKCGKSIEQPMPPRRGLRAKQEYQLGNGRRPDVAAIDEHGGLVFACEVYATNPVDEEKRRALESIPWAEFAASAILESNKWAPLVDHFGPTVFGPVVCPRCAACAAPRETIRGCFTPGGPLARQIDHDYEERPEQTKMASAVFDALDTKGVALIEAGTGTGKTLAYLLPAALHPGRTVISTHTINLQDQIAKKDVPLLASALGWSPQVIVMKGMDNYLCRRRLAAYSRSALGLQKDPRLPALEDWANETKTGDREEAAENMRMPANDLLWKEVRSESDERIGSGCPYFDSCFVTRLRERAKDARLVIVNHHLFFADLAIPGSYVLPPWDAVIFDEAHSLEDVAADFFGVKISSHRVERLRTDIKRSLQLKLDPNGGMRANTKIQETTLNTLDEAVGNLAGLVARLAELLARLAAGREKEKAAGCRVALGDTVKKEEAVKLYGTADSTIERLEQHLRTLGAVDGELARMAERCGELREDLAAVMKGDDEWYVAWVEWTCDGPGRPIRDVVLGRTPLDIAQILKENLFARDHPRPVVFTSATLADHRGFGFVRGRLGIAGDAKELRLKSPFNFEQQALLYVPKEMPDPNDEKTFLPALLQQTQKLLRITGGGALLLYTTWRNLRWMEKPLRSEGRYELLVQGDAPPNQLLKQLREKQNAVLLATKSFWQGVDVVGDALRLVVIDKLPFDVPTDPVVNASGARLERKGGNSFEDYQIPRAVLALRQGFGRLIRSQRDRGIVAVLDSRFYSPRYKGAFLAALPRCAEARDIAGVEAWWRANSHAPSAGPRRTLAALDAAR